MFSRGSTSSQILATRGSSFSSIIVAGSGMIFNRFSPSSIDRTPQFERVTGHSHFISRLSEFWITGKILQAPNCCRKGRQFNRSESIKYMSFSLSHRLTVCIGVTRSDVTIFPKCNHQCDPFFICVTTTPVTNEILLCFGISGLRLGLVSSTPSWYDTMKQFPIKNANPWERRVLNWFCETIVNHKTRKLLHLFVFG